MRIDPVRTPDDLRATAALFEAYARSLPVDLGYQDFGAELASLPGKYAPPRGELLLARDAAGGALGCVSLRPLPAAGRCEMKRLYLAPEARGTGLGRALAEAIIQTARDIGYGELRLDTLATMTSAIGLYRQLGFAEIEPYYAPTPPGTIFMALRL
ncbi:GNAT family N-acetyltransferase [Phenylobacterium sp. LH3H17]|uniref:GNAT family N-acetyltransferase n=1 Tax=Phenylobacterium sp. LH3H17 TaxID=2903901 RepID=UPI0020C9A5E3|nr:GNAT family N-acetyltransferase [Phenylobacterium sp. LH3H17]UTP41305.1 GNAT family N-acetyltransferase [Phenylobacterium sp. LH3H17]